MIQILATVEMKTILCCLAKQQLSTSQTCEWEILKYMQKELSIICQHMKLKYMQKEMICHMLIKVNEDKRICQVPWKDKFQSNESVLRSIHTWIKVLSWNLEKTFSNYAEVFLFQRDLHLASISLVCMTWDFLDFANPWNNQLMVTSSQGLSTSLLCLTQRHFSPKSPSEGGRVR